MVRKIRGLRGLLAGLLLAGLAAGCSATIPSDPDGTLERVRGDVLRVGVSPNPPWTIVTAADAPPAGTEAVLVEEFARSLDAEVEWTVGGEEALVGRLERGQLDLVVGGLTARSPWAEKAALTYRYTEAVGPEGEKELHVMAAPMGENAFLVELEHFLLGKDLA
ncbi:transporter substrate-binding domain-containing protein [Georgenia thermotolerans]|uniref:Transporter substrate-binding domain-containing protein n=1 Tax=Georgenia thermotolerans TaxID=527326 RepID=A0A7J5UMH9_9MICO|nr:transporter substrate-binding domain-containing protein [Georgenia thermotolerans]KAE8763588.1 transporter substrate-binding domain-containing protein [Georgenia thermotolerans]